MEFEQDVYDQDIKSTELLERLDFCGCGMPDSALKLINDVIQHIQKKNDGCEDRVFEGDKWKRYCADNDARLKNIIDSNHEGIEYVIYYLLDAKRITSHGGSVPGWIEDYEFTDKLKKYIDYINSEQE